MDTNMPVISLSNTSVPDSRSDPAELSQLRYLFEVFDRQGRTASGFPKVRPQDCNRLLSAITASAEEDRLLFRTKDPVLSEHFDRLVARLRASDIRAYPGEWLKLLLLVAKVRLQQNDWQAIRAVIGHYADRPYAIEADFDTTFGILWCDTQARALSGEVADLHDLAMLRMTILARLKPAAVQRIVAAFAPLVAAGKARPAAEGVFEYIISKYCVAITRLTRKRGSRSVAQLMRLLAYILRYYTGFTLYARRIGEIRTRPRQNMQAAPLVTRAMGGIGDFIMMTPGLRALSKKTGKPVRMAIPKKFFAIFENNPHVELIDIDETPIDLVRESRWYNLSNCPAARYESRKLPNINKGRVELFASGLGIKLQELKRVGQQPDIHLSPTQTDFRDKFLIERGLGERPIIGLQPFSRELYRDYPRMHELVAALAQRYDVLIFHHVDATLPQMERVATTAGLDLAQSLSLVSALNAMVSIDSSFLHAAAAFAVPVVALFGPIDGMIRTLHIPKAVLIQEAKNFVCAPCWRNEDEPCTLTKNTGLSPCMAAIDLQRILDAVHQLV